MVGLNDGEKSGGLACRVRSTSLTGRRDSQYFPFFSTNRGNSLSLQVLLTSIVDTISVDRSGITRTQPVLKLLYLDFKHDKRSG